MKFNFGLDRFSGLYLWAAFIVVFSFMAPQTFMTMTTVHILASTQAVAAIVALALLIPMVTGHFDISIGATANLCGLIAVVLLVNGFANPVTAVLIATLVGAIIGFVNGFVVVKLRVNSFIATLGMTSILTAIQIVITGNKEPVPTRNEFFASITQTKTIFGFQSVLIYLIVFAVLIWWVLERTPAGRKMHAIGGNPEAARLTGIRVDRYVWVSLIASASVSGFAGILFVSLTGPSLGFGHTLLLPAFAAVFLGSTQLSPGKMNVWGTLIAIFTLATGVQGLQLITGVQWVAPLFDGVALIAAVGLAVGRERRMSKGGGKRKGGVAAQEVRPSEARQRTEGIGVDEPRPNRFGPPGDDVD